MEQVSWGHKCGLRKTHVTIWEILSNIVLGRRGYDVLCLEMPACGTTGKMGSSGFWCERCQAG